MPVGSFSKRLLPTDRYCWSSENGKEEKLKENIKLPSFVWQWEHEWKFETTFEENDLDNVRYIIIIYLYMFLKIISIYFLVVRDGHTQSIFVQNFIQPNAGIHALGGGNGIEIEYTRARILGV